VSRAAAAAHPGRPLAACLLFLQSFSLVPLPRRGPGRLLAHATLIPLA